ncbi:hypothetical protein BWZ22_06105 [Seonamhaeicola sp. S2-3]|uniref:hypothetical protein n=1 Tax=Seonamhaeicola sp. S2-3 TaxID=1936081 RepID=UPI000972BF99|nr:hypothetical protein [Seonamhaeicola sp. S2-3]APY10836.1 hypothetical protein BWZ22_06105 [Seonamhaeicola sp. S2-3]
MDSQSILIGIVIAFICCIPFIIFYFNKKKQKQILINHLNDVAKKNNANISEFEIFNKSIIAVDKENLLAFYIKNDEPTIVDLKNTSHCFININRKPTKNSKKEIISTIDICFSQTSKNQYVFRVYNEEIDPPLSGETIFSNKWINTFNKQIKRIAA